MVRNAALERRLEKLAEYLFVLNKKRSLTKEEFVNNIEERAIVERFFELAIQAVNDIGGHIVSDKKLGEVEAYSDIPRRFFEADLIDEEITDSWIRMCGFRNILAHDYLNIDNSIVYQALQDHGKTFTKLTALFAQFL